MSDEGWITTPPDVEDNAELWITYDDGRLYQHSAFWVKQMWPNGHVLAWRRIATVPDPYIPPAPDPFTVLAWHPMDALPQQQNGHAPVLIVNAERTEVYVGSVNPQFDKRLGRGAWCPITPDLIAAIDQWAASDEH